jgi:hypothetical protein
MPRLALQVCMALKYFDDLRHCRNILHFLGCFEPSIQTFLVCPLICIEFYQGGLIGMDSAWFIVSHLRSVVFCLFTARAGWH